MLEPKTATATPGATTQIHQGPALPPIQPGERQIDPYFRLIQVNKCSDLHITTGCLPMVRKDGEMMAIAGEPLLTDEKMKGLIDEIIPEKNKKEFGEIWDTDFACALEGTGRFRVNIFMDRRGMGAVFRLIPSRVPTAMEIGLPENLLKLCQIPKGLILVTGPTGSGKSTTLAAMIDHINRTRSDHIITIEDPIEFVYPSAKCLVNQREVHRHTTSFARALRAALREDPDIVLVGEMRDLETTRIAIETAETGHLVFGTLHTSTAATTVDRMINQFPAGEQDQIRLMLSNSLKAVISQTLLKKRGGGRVAAREIMVCTSAIAALLREGKTHQLESTIQMTRKNGNILLNDSLDHLVKNNLVAPEDAYMKALDKEDMLKKLGGRIDVSKLE
jgi:twitching motility protein PilT